MGEEPHHMAQAPAPSAAYLKLYEARPEPALPAASAPAPAPDRSQWERVSLAPDVELHIRRPLTRQQNKRVDRLIAIGRELLEED
jgi:hypothetical protein